MEFLNNRQIKNFLSESERSAVLEFVDSLNTSGSVNSHGHIGHVAKHIKGRSYMFDISGTDVTKYISEYQSSKNVCVIEMPAVCTSIMHRIADAIGISESNVFLQVLDMDKGGMIIPHYDTAVRGFINYKCNVSVLSNNYEISVEDSVMDVNECDLYCFEASLYKHSVMNEFASRRVLLSYGFVLPYADLGRSESDYRVKLSERIQKYFQK